MSEPRPDQPLVAVTLDEGSVVRWNPEIAHEREVAIFDLVEKNVFAPVGAGPGPYALRLSIQESRLIFAIRAAAADDDDDAEPVTVSLPTGPLRRIVKDYFTVCESYLEAIKRAPPSRIEALDMGRRGLHDEGSTLLRERLEGKIEIDFDTARRLVTLLCVLHLRY